MFIQYLPAPVTWLVPEKFSMKHTPSYARRKVSHRFKTSWKISGMFEMVIQSVVGAISSRLQIMDHLGRGVTGAFHEVTV